MIEATLPIILNGEAAVSRYLTAAVMIAAGFCAHSVNHLVQEPSQDSAARDTERYAVYPAVLVDMFVRRPTKLLVIEDQTGDDSTAEGYRGGYLKNRLPSLSQATIEDFKSKADQPSALEGKFTLTTKVALISKSEVDEIFGQGGGWWKVFYEKYPNSPGLITFFNVGLNPGFNQRWFTSGILVAANAGRVTMCCSQRRTDNGKYRVK